MNFGTGDFRRVALYYWLKANLNLSGFTAVPVVCWYVVNPGPIKTGEELWILVRFAPPAFLVWMGYEAGRKREAACIRIVHLAAIVCWLLLAHGDRVKFLPAIVLAACLHLFAVIAPAAIYKEVFEDVAIGDR